MRATALLASARSYNLSDAQRGMRAESADRIMEMIDVVIAGSLFVTACVAAGGLVAWWWQGRGEAERDLAARRPVWVVGDERIRSEPTPVDRKLRREVAELLRHFAAGRVTNDRWDDAWVKRPRTPDRVVGVVWTVMWPYYSDMYEHTMSGKHALGEEMHGMVARMILFLYSDLPYEWPEYERMAPPVLAGESVWPFFRREDFEKARAARPVLLGGGRARVEASSQGA